MLHEQNPHIKLYKAAFELLSNSENTSNDDMINRFIRIHPDGIELVAGADKRTQNLPTAEEVAGIIPN